MIEKKTIIDGVETVEHIEEIPMSEPDPELVRKSIIDELDALDVDMSRPLEDLITWQMQNGYQPYAGQLEIIQRKQALREQLKSL